MSHHMSMGSMGSLPALTDFPGFYYAVVGSAVAVAAYFNVYNYILYRQRLAAARGGSRTPAKPRSWFALGNATTYALTREASSFSIRIPLKGRVIRLPTVGRTSLIVANAIVLVVLCLYGLDLHNQFNRENVGFRCGVVTIAQIPIIVLLAGKNNIIGCLSGISYERLNWLHRWCARCMLLTATMHMGYFFSAWAPYDYIGYQLKNNNIVWKGLAAWCTLLWMVLSSMTPIRGWSYEIFVIQHIISFAIFLAFVYIHTPVEMNGYVWAPVAIFLFDRVFRALRLLYINLSIFHPSQRKQGQMKGFWACKAEFTPLPHNTTRIVVRNPPLSWTPGQHVYLSCQSVVPLQSHPFTIASIPQDGKMEFYVKAEKGGTKRFYRHAKKSGGLSEASLKARSVTIEGPYGVLRPLRQFDSVVLFAGSTGSTFTMPLLRDLIQGWQENAYGDVSRPRSFLQAPSGIVTRHVRFVWVVKSRSQLSWFSEQLCTIYTDFQALQQKLRDIKLEMSVYITCDSSFTEGRKSLISSVTAASPANPISSDSEKEAGHGIAQYRPLRQSTGSDNAKENKGDGDSIREVRSSSSSSMELQDLSCAQNKTNTATTCCCRSTVSESDPLTPRKQCRCSAKSLSQSRPNSLTPLSPSTKNVLVHPSIAVLSGRPKTRDILRHSLEQAWGESAVVVCGPLGLVADVKSDVVALSDERAVHKGTGAQGVYLHTESFGW
ncbi:ferric-chelate reductase [Stemphylium lycopersici]|nr:ferric-chelate reductase [Stemphylium lycopersici]